MLILLERTKLIVFQVLVFMEALFLLSGSCFFHAKSNESIMSVVPVRFAFPEAVFLSSEGVREVFWARHHQGALNR